LAIYLDRPEVSLASGQTSDDTSTIKQGEYHMAKKGSTKRVTGEWAKHLRKDGKRIANKTERQSAKIK